MSNKPKILNETVVAQSRLFTIQALDMQFSNGERRTYERVCGKAPGSVMVIPLIDRNTVLLIEEYGAGIDEYVLGFPKGAVHHGEDVLETANRELQEEVGYKAQTLQHLGEVSASPSYFSAMMQLIIATDLVPSSLPGDEPEPIKVVPWSLDDIDSLLANPKFNEARSIAALLWVYRRIHS